MAVRVMKSSWKQRAGLLSLILTCLTFAIAFAIYFFPLYAWDIKHLGIEQMTGLSKEVLMKEYHELMKYLTFPWDNHLSLDHFPMSKSGRSHFDEVKNLFLLNNLVLLVTIIPSFLFVRNLKKSQQLWRLVCPFEWVAVVPIVLGFLMMAGFQTFFEEFHHVLFRNSDWIFDPATDPIILALPEEFFMHCFILAFLVLEILAITWIVTGKRQLKKSASDA